MAKQVDLDIFAKTRKRAKGVRYNFWQRKHDMSETRLYNCWLAIKQRCYNKNNPKYRIYGGKGVCVCEEWKNDFISFMKWALDNGYKCDLTIDRIDASGNYCPENCRWASIVEQNNNTSRNVFVEYNGKKMSISQWAKQAGICRGTLESRLKKGWDIERALTEPVDLYYRRNYKR